MTATVHNFPLAPTIPLDALSLEQAERHVALVAGSGEAMVCLRLIHDSDRDAEAIKLEGSVRGLWPEIEARQAQGFGVFVVVNEGGHKASEITRIRAAFIDADGLPLPNEWHVRPAFLVQRDDTHWHAYWPVAGLAVEDFRDTQQRLAARYGSDRTVCDRSRVMRLAGTLHLKDPADPYSIILDETCGDPCQVGLNAAELVAGLPEIVRAEPSKSAVSGLPLPASEITARLACCDPDCAYPDWRDLAGALHATPCADPDFDTRQAFADWSRAGSKFEADEDCYDVFDTMPPKPGGLGAGSFIRITNHAGYRGPTVGKNDQPAAEVFGEIVAGLVANDAPPVAGRILLRDEAAQDVQRRSAIRGSSSESSHLAPIEEIGRAYVCDIWNRICCLLFVQVTEAKRTRICN